MASLNPGRTDLGLGNIHRDKGSGSYLVFGSGNAKINRTRCSIPKDTGCGRFAVSGGNGNVGAHATGESAARPLVRELKADAGAGDGFTSLISDLDRYGVRDSRSRAVDLTFPVEGADAEDAGGFGLNGTEDEESGENDRKLIRPPGE